MAVGLFLPLAGVMARPGKGPLYTGRHFMLLGVRGLIGPPLRYGLLKAGVPTPLIYVVIGGIVLAGTVALIPLRAAFRFCRLISVTGELTDDFAVDDVSFLLPVAIPRHSAIFSCADDRTR